MAQTVDKETERKNDKQIMYTVASKDKVTLENNQYIKSDCNSWQQIGINHIMNTETDKKTKWTVKIIKEESNNIPNIMIGLATKHIINITDDYAGHYMYGWTFHSKGQHYNFGKYTNTLNYNGYMRWATNDVITIQFCNYTLTLIINDYKAFEWKMKEYPKLKQQELLPVICVCGKAMYEFLGVSEE